MKAYGYARVSTERQAESGLSMDAQRMRIKTQADLHGYDLVSIIEDAGASGKNLRRPGMVKVLSLVNQGRLDVLIVAKLDRASRSVVDLSRLIDLLRKARRADGGQGVDLISSSESLDTTSAAGRLTINVLASVAAWEREAISERTAEALARKRANGYAIGTAPYGFSKDGDGRLIEHAEERGILDTVRTYRDAGEKWVRIARHLNRRGYRTRRGSVFSRQGVQKIARTAGIE